MALVSIGTPSATTFGSVRMGVMNKIVLAIRHCTFAAIIATVSPLGDNAMVSMIATINPMKRAVLLAWPMTNSGARRVASVCPRVRNAITKSTVGMVPMNPVAIIGKPGVGPKSLGA